MIKLLIDIRNDDELKELFPHKDVITVEDIRTRLISYSNLLDNLNGIKEENN